MDHSLTLCVLRLNEFPVRSLGSLRQRAVAVSPVVSSVNTRSAAAAAITVEAHGSLQLKVELLMLLVSEFPEFCVNIWTNKNRIK